MNLTIRNKQQQIFLYIKIFVSTSIIQDARSQVSQCEQTLCEGHSH